MRFDLIAFKARWRELCAERGIDPVEGATSFQVAAYKADIEKARKRAAATGWWRNSALWWQPGRSFSDVEADCYTRLFWAAWGFEVDQWGKSASALADVVALRPLREIVDLDSVQIEIMDINFTTCELGL